MFRKLSLLTIVTVVGMNAQGGKASVPAAPLAPQTIVTPTPAPVTPPATSDVTTTAENTGFFNWMKGKAKVVVSPVVDFTTEVVSRTGKTVKAIFNTDTYRWPNVKNYPSDTLAYISNHKVGTAVAAALVIGAIIEYKTRVIRDAIFGAPEEDETKEEDEVYFVGKEERARAKRAAVVQN